MRTHCGDFILHQHVQPYVPSFEETPEEHRKVMEVKDREHQGLQQATLQEAIASAVPYAKDSKRARQLVGATADFICQGLQPISIVDEPSFRTLLTIANPKFQLPHRTYFSTKASC